MISDTRYTGDINSDLEADLIAFYLDSESRRIELESERAVYDGIDLVYDIKKEREKLRVLGNVMALKV